MDDLYDYWFSLPLVSTPSQWFDKTIDKEVYEKFYPLYESTVSTAHDSPKQAGRKDLIGRIILLDQLSRNFKRIEGAYVDPTADDRCFELSRRVVGSDLFPTLTLFESVFVLLPYRHQRTLKAAERLVTVWDGCYDRFGSNRWWEKFQQENLIEYGNHYHHQLTRPIIDLVVDDFTRFIPVMDDRVTVKQDGWKTVYAEDLNPTLFKSPAYDEMVKFLQSTVISLGSEKGMGQRNGLIVSLSGGVDSMVEVWLLKQLEKRFGHRTISFHINYGNRDEADDEEKMIRAFAASISVPLYVLKIKHLHRKDGRISREFYEKETRRIRFNCYKILLQRCNGIGVLMGHHAGDVAENVLANMLKGHSLLELPRMAMVSMVDGVRLMRPFYHIFKAPILDLAARLGIPYTINTTPSWSRRGMMREQLFPLLRKMFGEDIEANLFRAGLESDRLDGFYRSRVVKPIIDRVIGSDFGWGIRVDDGTELDETDFYKLMVTRFHNLDWGMMSHRCFRSILGRIERERDRAVSDKYRSQSFLVAGTVRCCLDTEWLIFYRFPTDRWRIRSATIISTTAATTTDDDVETKEEGIRMFLSGSILFSIPNTGADVEYELVDRIKDKKRRSRTYKQYFGPKMLLNEHPKLIPTTEHVSEGSVARVCIGLDI